MAAHQAPRPWDSSGKNTGVGHGSWQKNNILPIIGMHVIKAEIVITLC